MRLVSLTTIVLVTALLAGVLLIGAAVQGMADVDRDLELAALRAPDRMLVQETGERRERPPWCDRERSERREHHEPVYEYEPA